MKFIFSIFAAFIFFQHLAAESISFQYMNSGHVFISGKPISFSVNGKSKGVCRIYTYDRTKVFEQDLVLPKNILIPELLNGYYFVEFTIPESNEIFKSDFAVVTDPAKRNVPVDSPYSLDCALGGTAKIDEWLEIARLLGVKFVRERFQQTATESIRGKYNWNVYGRSARKFFENGICVSATFHQFAPWARKSADLSFPEDLFTAYNFAKTISAKFKNEIKVWEAWNEPELFGFNKEGPWEYVAMMKAASLGFKAGAPDHSVANGAYCQRPWNNIYAQAVFRNDLSDYTDIFNFHTYDSLSAIPKIVSEWKKILQRAGVEDQMIWVTEAGTRAEGYGVVYPGKGPFHYLSPEQEMIWAECIPKLQILLQNLGRAKCLGEVDLGKDMRGFLYQQPDRSYTLAFWSISELDVVDQGTITFDNMKKRNFDIPGNEILLITPFGTPRKLSGINGKIQVPSVRLVSYLRNVPAMKIKKTPEKEGMIGPRKRIIDRSVVLRIRPSSEFKLSDSRLSMLLNDSSKDKSMVIQVANFSDQTKKATITVSGCSLPGFPAEVTLKPFSVTEIKTSADKLKLGKYTCIFAGKSNDPPISQMEFPFLITSAAGVSHIPVTGSEKPGNWKPNSSGKMEITFDEPNQSLRIDVDFPPNCKDKWGYPIFKLPSGFPKDTQGLSFDIKVEVAGKKASYYTTFFKEKGKKCKKLPYIPENHKWKHVFVDFDELGILPQNLENFQIGLNVNKQNSATWFIRNIQIIKK